MRDEPTNSLPSKSRCTGERSGIRGIAAVALLREGKSLREAAEICALSVETVMGVRDRYGAGLAQIESIRKVIKDIGLLQAAAMLTGIAEEEIQEMKVHHRIDAACKLLERCAAPEPVQQPAQSFLSQYNIMLSHSASSATLEQKHDIDHVSATGKKHDIDHVSVLEDGSAGIHSRNQLINQQPGVPVPRQDQDI